MSSEDVEKIVAAILAVGCASKSRGAVDPWHFVQLYAGTLAELKKLPNTGAAENLEKDSRNNQREGSRAPRS